MSCFFDSSKSLLSTLAIVVSHCTRKRFTWMVRGQYHNRLFWCDYSSLDAKLEA